MEGSLIHWLSSQTAMQIVRGLLLSGKAIHLREISSRYSLSPAGASDILRRLIEAGVLKESRQGNRRYFSLNLPAQELEWLKDFFAIYERKLIRARSKHLSENAKNKFDWMDEAYRFYRNLGKLRNDTTRSA